jgi:hypothetical protein
LRDFGEELFHASKEDGSASIPLAEVDQATNQLCVRVRSAKRVRRIASMIEALIDRHHLGDVTRLSQVKLPVSSTRTASKGNTIRPSAVRPGIACRARPTDRADVTLVIRARGRQSNRRE